MAGKGKNEKGRGKNEERKDKTGMVIFFMALVAAVAVDLGRCIRLASESIRVRGLRRRGSGGW
jgi:hypothetical protein